MLSVVNDVGTERTDAEGLNTESHKVIISDLFDLVCCHFQPDNA